MRGCALEKRAYGSLDAVGETSWSRQLRYRDRDVPPTGESGQGGPAYKKVGTGMSLLRAPSIIWQNPQLHAAVGALAGYPQMP